MWLCATNLGAQLCVDGWIAPPVQCWFRQLLNLGIGSLKYREKNEKRNLCTMFGRHGRWQHMYAKHVLLWYVCVWRGFEGVLRAELREWELVPVL